MGFLFSACTHGDTVLCLVCCKRSPTGRAQKASFAFVGTTYEPGKGILHRIDQLLQACESYWDGHAGSVSEHKNLEQRSDTSLSSKSTEKTHAMIMHRRHALAALMHFAHMCAGREVCILFRSSDGSIAETKMYDTHRKVFAVSEYLRTEIDRRLCGESVHKSEAEELPVVLECASSAFDITADLLDGRALDVEVRQNEVAGVLHLATLLNIAVSERAGLYRSLAGATINDENFIEQIGKHGSAPDIKLFMLQMLRDYTTRYGVQVRVFGSRATLFFSGRDKPGYYGSRDKAEVVDSVRILARAMDILRKKDGSALDLLKSFVKFMGICELEVARCRKLDADVFKCIGDMKGLKRLCVAGSYNAKLRGLWHLRSLESLAELDVSGSRLEHPGKFTFASLCCSREERVWNAGLSAIGNLAGLRKLSIRRCRLEPGSLWHIKDLEHLSELNVSGNRLGRSDMLAVGSMRNLTKLDMSDCELEPGSVQLLKDLGKVRELNVSRNALGSGDISAIGRMKSLNLLDVGFCDLGPEGLEHLADLECLMEIRVSGNVLSKNNISSIGNMKSLKKLSMCDCTLESGGFEKIGSLESLQELNISRTSLDRGELQTVGAMKSLVALNMGFCRLRPGSLGCLESLRNIAELSVPKNALNKADMEAIGCMAGLTKLDVRCALEAGSLCHIENLRCIRSLNVSENRLNESDMSVIGRMRELEELSMFGCERELGSLAYLKDLDNLKCLDVGRSSLNLVDMQAIGNMKNLARLGLSSCAMLSRRLLHLKDMENLTNLDISHNMFFEKKDKSALNEMCERDVYICE